MSQAEVFTATNSYWVCLRVTLTWFSEVMLLLLSNLSSYLWCRYLNLTCTLIKTNNHLISRPDHFWDTPPVLPQGTHCNISLTASALLGTVMIWWTVSEQKHPASASSSGRVTFKPVVIFHRGQQLRMWSMQRPKHAVLSPPAQSFLYP